MPRAGGPEAPEESELSLWLERFTTVSGTPTRRASCCTNAVFPVPVSPTKSTGSTHCTALATRSRMRIAWPVLDQEEEPPAEAEPGRLNLPVDSGDAGNVARPTATAPFPARALGLCAESLCFASSALSPQTLSLIHI